MHSSIKLLLLAACAAVLAQALPMEQDATDNRLDQLNQGWAKLRAHWASMKTHYMQRMDELSERAQDKFDEIKKETTETVENKAKNWDSKVSREDLEKFFEKANDYLEEQFDVKPWIAALPKIKSLLEANLQQSKPHILEMLRKVEELWNRHKSADFTAEAEKAIKFLQSRLEMGRAAMRAVYNKYGADIDYVAKELTQLVTQVKIQIQGLKSDDLADMATKLTSLFENIRSGPIFEIYQELMKLGQKLRADVIAMKLREKSSNLKQLVNTEKLMQIAMSFKEEPFVKAVTPLLESLVGLAAPIITKVAEVQAMLASKQ